MEDYRGSNFGKALELMEGDLGLDGCEDENCSTKHGEGLGDQGAVEVLEGLMRSVCCLLYIYTQQE